MRGTQTQPTTMRFTHIRLRDCNGGRADGQALAIYDEPTALFTRSIPHVRKDRGPTKGLKRFALSLARPAVVYSMPGERSFVDQDDTGHLAFDRTN